MHLHSSVLVALAALFAGNARAGVVQRNVANSAVKNVVVFGDSFSDNGNGSYRITNSTWPADPAYYDGRFSNGPVWVEDVASKLKLTLHDFAVGGSTSDNHLTQGYTGFNSTILVPSALDQLSMYLGGVKANANLGDTLFIILTGANDAFFDANATGADTAKAVVTIIEKLRKRGYIDAATAAQLHKWSIEFRAEMKALAASQVTYVDLYALFSELFANPRQYGYDPAEITKSCLTGAYGEAPRSLCSDPDEYIFWDEYHPTTKTHRFIAAAAEEALLHTLQ
ncbi:hypothetical protein HWV62_1358 [Athelia sp. TMB]|nr:hypothetical protein HWV62_10142 [Athelia sp. TMB]KAF7978169.1 hypothetical protein HWV62_1358 [Athelia sp. TMB]